MKSKFRYGLFYDFHTFARIPDVGAVFDAEAFTDQVKSCGVDFLTWHARCNQGNAYYDTKIGWRHPSLRFDMIRALGNACRKKGITFSVYFNGHLSDEELLKNRDWMFVGMKGETYCQYEGLPGFNTPGVRAVCYNSPYKEHIQAMVRELLENEYPIDGFFFDCLAAQPCICPHCAEEMQEKGIDCSDPEAVHRFGLFSVRRFCTELNDLIRQYMPDALLYFNGRPDEEVIGMESHLECECLPTAAWGYESLPVYAHYLRTLAGGKPVLNMTGRFNDWGDFGGLRTAEGLEYDLFYGAANGMRPDIGGHAHPRGDLDLPVFDRIREVYAAMQKYDEWVLDAVNEPEIALVYPLQEEKYRPSGTAVESAVRMLTELKIQFDLVTEFASWDRYRLLIFPDDVLFTPSIAERVKKHLSRGGKVLASSRSGLDSEGKRFALSDWPAVYQGAIGYDPLYFMPAGPLAEGLPVMPLSVYASGTKVEPAADAKTEMFLVKPHLPYGWDGLRTSSYNPPDRVTEEPFLVRNEKIVYISGELFTGYAKRAPKQLRELLRNAIRSLVPDLKLRTKNLPSFARAFVQKKENTELVHLLAYCPEGRGQASAVEDRITLADAEISLRTDGRQARKVCLAPDRKELPFEQKDGYCIVRVPRIDGYGLLVFGY